MKQTSTPPRATLRSPEADSDLIGKLPSPTRRRLQMQAARILLIVAILFAWQIFSGAPGTPLALIDDFYISRPSAMFEVLRIWMEKGILIPNILVTLQETVLGFVIGALLGMAGGFLLGTNRYLGSLLSPVLAALYAIPA
jgi:NitT/TauT family transport system permease protein